MITVKNGKLTEISIKKSKFISIALNVANEYECVQILADYKNKYNDCTHLTFAYVVGNTERCSDDGEPSGTAGKPLLNIIKQKSLSNTLIIVIRYFGGIKLGAGGLVRAYTESGVKALENAEITELKSVINIKFHINYDEAFNIYVLTTLKIFTILSRVGNDFIIECTHENLENTIRELKKFHVSKVEVLEVLK